jgi:hypothetical protein
MCYNTYQPQRDFSSYARHQVIQMAHAIWVASQLAKMPYRNLPVLLALSCETYLQEFCNISDNISEDKFFLVTVKPPKFADASKKSHQGLNNKIWKFGPGCQVIQNIIA